MLSKDLKIPKVLFKNIQNTKSFSGDFCTIRFLPHPTLVFSCVISKKIAPKAHTRNLLKRRIFSCARDLSLPPGAYFIFPKTKAVQASFYELKKDLNILCGKINVL